MFLQSPCSTPLISSDEENWTPPSAVAGDVKRREDKNVISLVPISVRPKFSFPTNIPRIKDFRKKKAITMKFKSAASDPKLRQRCIVRVKRLSNDEVKRLRYVWIRKTVDMMHVSVKVMQSSGSDMLT